MFLVQVDFMITAAQSVEEPSAAVAVREMEQKIADTNYAWPSNLGSIMAPGTCKVLDTLATRSPVQGRKQSNILVGFLIQRACE